MKMFIRHLLFIVIFFSTIASQEEIYSIASFGNNFYILKGDSLFGVDPITKEEFQLNLSISNEYHTFGRMTIFDEILVLNRNGSKFRFYKFINREELEFLAYNDKLYGVEYFDIKDGYVFASESDEYIRITSFDGSVNELIPPPQYPEPYLPNWANEVLVFNNALFGNGSESKVIDISDFTNPIVRYIFNSGIKSFYNFNNYLVSRSSNRLKIYNISNPFSPGLKFSQEIPNVGNSFHYKEHLFIKYNDSLVAYNLNNPANVFKEKVINYADFNINSTSINKAAFTNEFILLADENNYFVIPNEITTSVEDVIPNEITYNLEQNYPNPFNPSTSIEYSLNSNEHVSLKVYNVLGKEVAILVNEEKSPGVYEVQFNAGKLSSGVYFYKLSTASGSYSKIKKMLLVK